MKKLVPQEIIEQKIFMIRGHKVMLDIDLSDLYGIPTKVLTQTVKRNIERFPRDFMFQLDKEEFKNLRSQFVTSSWGGRRYSSYAFTEQGVAMLSSNNKTKPLKGGLNFSFRFTRRNTFYSNLNSKFNSYVRRKS